MEQFYTPYLSIVPNSKSSSEIVTHHHHFIEDFSRGYKVCIQCGYVADDLVFSQQQPFLNKKQNLNYISSNSTSSFHFSKISSSSTVSPNLERAFKLEKKIPWIEKKVTLGKVEIQRLASTFLLPKTITERGFYLFQKICHDERFRTHYINLMCQVCLYYAAKEQGYPIILEDIINQTNYKISLAQRYYYLLITVLNLPNISANATAFIHRYGTRLHLDSKLIQKAVKILLQFSKIANLSGCDVRGIAAGVLYFTCIYAHIPISQKIIAQIAGISEITIRSRYKHLRKLHLSVRSLSVD